MKNLQLLILVSISSCIWASPLYAQNKKALKYFAKAETAIEDRKLIQASVDLTKAISHYQEYAEAYYLRGRTFIDIGQQAAGINDLKAAIRYDSLKMMPYVLLVKQLKINNADKEALAYLDAMATSNPDNIGIMHFEKAQYYEANNEPKKTLHHYEMAVQTLDPSKGPNYDAVLAFCKEKVKEMKK